MKQILSHVENLVLLRTGSRMCSIALLKKFVAQYYQTNRYIFL